MLETLIVHDQHDQVHARGWVYSNAVKMALRAFSS
jgi:hypothetical protein